MAISVEALEADNKIEIINLICFVFRQEGGVAKTYNLMMVVMTSTMKSK